MSKPFNNFVAKHMHKAHRPMVEQSKRNKMLDDLAELEQNEIDLTEVCLPKARDCISDYQYDVTFERK